MSAVFWAPQALSAEAAEGYVVFLDKKELVVNLGTEHGLVPTSKILLYRRLVVTHPYSNQPIVDRFPIGEVALAEVGKKLSIVRRWKGLSRPPARGDIAVFKAKKLPKTSVAKPILTAKNRKNMPPDGVALQNVFASVLGQPIADRIRAYEDFIRAFPKSAHVDAVGNEIQAMRAFEKSMRTPKVAAKPVAPAKPKKPEKIIAKSKRPGSIFLGEDLEIVVAVYNPGLLHQVNLLVAPSRLRVAPNTKDTRAKEGWTVVEMTRDGDYYYRANIPAELTKKAGQLDYFIEAVRRNATFEPIYKSAKAPGSVVINPPLPDDTAPGKTEVSILGRMVDFNQPGEARDAYNQFETSISYAVNYKRLKAVRFGIGTISGGCTLSDAAECVDDWQGEKKEADERRLSFNYAFAEAEVGGRWFGLAGRITGGNHQGGVGNTASKANGFEVRARLGELKNTRLVFGMASLDDLGSKGFLDAHIEVFEKIPLKAGVVVTSLPVTSKDWGVQLSAQGGYRVTDMLSVQGLLGWNARTINHYGFTLGGGLGLEW